MFNLKKSHLSKKELEVSKFILPKSLCEEKSFFRVNNLQYLPLLSPISVNIVAIIF
jgi:hypothetical protein